MNELKAGILRDALDSLLVKRIPRLDELPPEYLAVNGIDPVTMLPHEA